MNELSEFITFLDKKNPELIDIIEKEAKRLVKKDGFDADLPFKNSIRIIDNFHHLLEWYFKNKFPSLISSDVPKKDNTLMTVKEVATELGLTEVTIYTYIKNGTIEAKTIGTTGKRGNYRILREEIQKLKGGN